MRIETTQRNECLLGVSKIQWNLDYENGFWVLNCNREVIVIYKELEHLENYIGLVSDTVFKGRTSRIYVDWNRNDTYEAKELERRK